MASDHFKNVAMTLNTACGNAGVVLDTYSLLHLADALIAIGFDANDRGPELTEHSMLVDAAIGLPECVEYMRQTKKIMAIKVLRDMTGCGLKAAKDAVEDDRMGIHVNLISDPWGVGNAHEDEPPF
jgi:hypothetical protein